MEDVVGMELPNMPLDIQSTRASQTPFYDNIRPFSCEFCNSTFNRRDVLKRHERTCKSRCSFGTEHQPLEVEESCPSDDRAQKRHRVSVSASGIDLRAAPGPFPLAAETTLDPRYVDLPHLSSSFTEPSTTINPHLHCQSELVWRGNELALSNSTFDPIGSDNEPALNMPSPLDFSSLDCFLFPQMNTDLFIAERLEFMAYFTSTQGMRTFSDQESFRRRQKMAHDAHEAKYALTQNGGLDGSDIPDLKCQELIGDIRDIVSNKRNDDVITLEWTASTEQMCRGFFTASKTRRFLDYFWSLWYPHCPIVHKPLFDASSASPALLCVMLIIGACLSPDESDRSTARKWLDCVEELIFRHSYFRSDRELSPEQRRPRKEIVQCIQAAYLVSSLQKREGSAEAQARIRRHRHASMVALARHIGPRKASHRHLELNKASNTWWQQFAGEEELIRTIIFVFLIDAALTIFHNSPPRMVVPELKMDVACPEACFQAESAGECMRQLKFWAKTRFWKHRLSIVSVVRRICQSAIDESLVQEFSQLGTLNLFTMVQSIHSLMFHLHNSLVFESTLAPIQTGLENWHHIWNVRIPEDNDIPDIPGNLWKQVGFLRHASEFWHLARLLLGKMISSSHSDHDELEETTQQMSRYDHSDMGDVNELIMDYRRMELGVV
ncbi:hypothetical protein N7532_007881 [Penicillium argentinense]|uniref:C2H2-type domain-containing protein n=1 Tax=Penicillium argentinense TaxID=1131581 RepID=A0A9W9EWD0_9EURO|nr:uncharacterized protein N7532_007881 [Penicillium argentinense]KAJ5089197.1 hypothetical protein N7532_007881 [Penicillium argentinense]